MLLRFSVENYKSIRERQELSLVASTALRSERDDVLIDTPATVGAKALPAAVVYGPNASGKSNLVDALREMRNHVLFSFRENDPNGGVHHKSFVLDDQWKTQPTRFSIDFLANSVHYYYAFSTNSERFLSEELLSYPRGRKQTLFERKQDKFEFGRGLTGPNKAVEQLTRPNSLFVSSANQSNHESLSSISDFFRSLRMVGLSEPCSMRFRDDPDIRTIEFLGRIGTGIVGFDFENDKPEMAEQEANGNYDISKLKGEENSDPRQLELLGSNDISDNKYTLKRVSSNFSSTLRLFMMRDFPPMQEKRLCLAHRSKYGGERFLYVEDESTGTQRLLHLLNRVFVTLDCGGVLVIDELDASLHTQACEAIVALFASKETNPRGAQLIATTHDTNLLNSEFLRRDQIWLTEKDDEGATHLYPLTDIRTRKGDNIEKGYLQGRFGAVPFAGRIEDILPRG